MLDVLDVEPTSEIGDPLVTAAEFTISTVEVVYDDGTRHTVTSTPRTFDALTPTDPFTIGVVDVPAGTITAVDVQIDDASVTRDGEVLTVDVAGGGLIAVSPPVLVELGCTTVVDLRPQHVVHVRARRRPHRARCVPARDRLRRAPRGHVPA
jgi:hypothetical protein